MENEPSKTLKIEEPNDQTRVTGIFKFPANIESSQHISESDGVFPTNMMLLSHPDPQNKIINPTEYIEPSNEYNMTEDNRENRRLLGILYDQRNGLLSVNGGIRTCNFCGKKSDIYFHCFKCDDYNLCEDCYSSKNGYHEHNGNINYFHKMTESPFASRLNVSLKENSVLEMMECFSIYSDRYFIGTRSSVNDHMTWLRFHEVQEKMENFIRGAKLHQIFQHGDYFGFLCRTSVEWIVSDFSCLYCGMISVPIHYTLGYEEKKYIVDLTRIKYLLVSSEHLEESLRLLRSCKSLEYLIFVPQQQENEIKRENVQMPSEDTKFILNFEELENQGRQRSDILISPNTGLKDEDIVSVMFTSGTTSKPKGVVLTEKTWRDRDSGMHVFPVVQVLFSSPSHMSGKILILSCLQNGGRFSILTNNHMKYLFMDLKYVSPTYLSVPPRILNFVYNHFKGEVKRKFLERIRTKKEDEERKMKKEIEDETFLEFRYKKDEYFGSSCIIISTGGAPTSTKVKRFIRMISDTPVYEGYGISECGSLMYNGGTRRGMKLMDCPGLGYLGSDLPYPRGEICVRDDGRIRRYFTDEKKNRRIDSDGWYHTGDIGMDIRGEIVVIDRMSNIIKLSNGEFFSIEKVERRIKQKLENHIEEILLFPNKVKTKLFGLVKLVGAVDQEEHEILELIQNEMKELRKWQLPCKILIINEEFTVENKMLTISRKKNRRKIMEYFDDVIQNVFFKNEEEEIEDWINSFLHQKSKKKKEIISEKEKSFYENGLDSLSAIRFINEVKNTFHQTIGFQDVMNSSLSQMIQKVKNKSLRGPEKDTISTPKMIRFEDELKTKRISELIHRLELDINQEEEIEGEDQNVKKVFFTGCTGFVGSFVLKNLIAQKNIEKVYCLVRPRSKKKMKFEDQKIVIIEGDLSSFQFGLSSTQFQGLQNLGFDVILHCGCCVNHLLSYDDLFDVNVKSMFEILKLSNGKIPVHYISSLSVYRDPRIDVFDQIHGTEKGYAATKFMSDCLFQYFSKKGVPVAIHRLNLVGFSKLEGTRNVNDWMSIFLEVIIKSKLVPELSDDRIPMDILSVDFVSEIIVQESMKKINGLKQFNYSMKNCSMMEFMKFVVKYFSEINVSVKIVSDFGEWIESAKKVVLKENLGEKYLKFLEIWKSRGRMGNLSWEEIPVLDSSVGREEKYKYQEFKRVMKDI